MVVAFNRLNTEICRYVPKCAENFDVRKHFKKLYWKMSRFRRGDITTALASKLRRAVVKLETPQDATYR
jgi:hypothetical protein